MSSEEIVLPRVREAQVWQDLIEQVQENWHRGEYDRAGDTFEDLRSRSLGWLLAIARRTGPSDQAEDIVAQTFVEIVEMIESGRPIRRVKGLLGTIVRNKVTDLLRREGGTTLEYLDNATRQGGNNTIVADSDAPLEVIERQEGTRAVANAILDVLPAPQREVLVARYVDELSVVATAARLGITQDQVKKRTQHAIASARRFAEEQELLDDLA